MNRKRGNGSIYRQPGCKTWMISYYAWNGKRIRESTGFIDYRAAQQRLHQRLAAVGKGEPIEPYRKKQVTISELYEALTRHYRINGRKSLDAVGRRWKHLKPFFAELPAQCINNELLNRYIDQRLAENAANATVNRELSALKTMLRLGARTHRFPLPLFPHLAENNVRTGFIEQADFERLRGLASEAWLRLFLEIAFEYGWRKREIIGLRVRQVNVRTGLIRLDVGSTKNNAGREVVMSARIRELVRLAIVGKNPDDYLLTRNGTRVKDFRKTWQALVVAAGLGRMVCAACGRTADGRNCQECGSRKLKYVGQLLHDFRRSAARELRRAGVPESTIMDIAGWKTREVFKRYAITDSRDIAAAISKREQARSEFSHDFGHDFAETAPEAVQPTTASQRREVQ